MNYFSIKDIELLSGIKAHTFRIWEQRHGLRFCKRKNSLHRYYDNEDLKTVLRISYLYHQGYKISKIASLSTEEILKLASATIDEDNKEFCIHQLIEATIDYDQQWFEKIVQSAITRYGFERSFTIVFYPFMKKIGLLWITEHLIPAQEHFSTAILQHKLLVAINGLEPPTFPCKETVLIFAPEGEMHEIPLLIALYLLKKHGVKTVYFGVNICLHHIEDYCSHKQITHLYFNLITNFLNKEPGRYINSLAEKFPGITIMASGPAIKVLHTPHAAVKIIIEMGALVPALYEV